MELKVTLDTGSFLPERAHRDDAGADLEPEGAQEGNCQEQKELPEG